MGELLAALRALAETTRLRLLVLCARGELTVSELAQILGQSQPRVSRHLKLLCEAGLYGSTAGTGCVSVLTRLPKLQHPLSGDHGRLLANAIGELRRSIKRQPAVFELMADTFTLFELQKTVEAILGPHLHKQNFRRLVEAGGLVAPTGEHRLRTGGRPARLYRFRPDVLLERLAPGVRVSGRT